MTDGHGTVSYSWNPAGWLTGTGRPGREFSYDHDRNVQGHNPRPYERPVSDEFSVALGREIARVLVDDPDAVLTAARRNLALMRLHGDGSADDWFDRWERLLDGPVEAVVQVLTSDAEPDRLTRHNTPFAGVVPEPRRQEILRNVRNARRAQGVRQCDGINSSM